MSGLGPSRLRLYFADDVVPQSMTFGSWNDSQHLKIKGPRFSVYGLIAQAGEFRYLGVLFMSDRRVEQGIDRRLMRLR